MSLADQSLVAQACERESRFLLMNADMRYLPQRSWNLESCTVNCKLTVHSKYGFLSFLFSLFNSQP